MKRKSFYIIVLLGMLIVSACSTKNEITEIPKVPEWAQQAVWYQIFPERFHNADNNNNPTGEHIGAPEGWEITKWTSDWYARSDWEKNASPSFYPIVRMRRYGGDLQGVINKLDYLKEMGITAIYFNPIFDARTEHKYDASFYHHIDRFFGPDPKGDEEIMKQEDFNDPSTWKWTSADKIFLELIQEAHKKGIHIVIDGVFNHTGQNFWAFADIVKNQENSKYSDWYDIISWDNPETPDINEFDFKGWANYKGLPEFKELDGNIVEPARKHILDITKRWMDPNNDGDPTDGIDGWRLDVAFDIGHNFWKEWTAFVRSNNPNAYITAEIWEREQAMEYISEEEFDAVMNYPFTRAVHEFFIQQTLTANDFDSALALVRSAYSKEVNLAMMNLMGSHDTERLASMIVNSNNTFKDGTVLGKDSNKNYDISAPTPQHIQLQKLVALFQYTYMGSPMTYYGDEAGMFGPDDPDDRKPMIWPEFEYDDEVNHPFNKETPVSKVLFNKDLYRWYIKIGSVRNSNEALQLGDYKTLYTNADEKVIVFARFIDDKLAIVGFNRGVESIDITVNIDFVEHKPIKLTNAITQEVIEVDKNKVSLTIDPIAGIVLVN